MKWSDLMKVRASAFQYVDRLKVTMVKEVRVRKRIQYSRRRSTF